ncbi:iron-containing alcohol dehydrogenase [Aneurinibacillus tyrosinisolvens]|uniref:iron-containing alcohol dehydrogenase n=1 Tax=Aneurinibacillus tyrosinisolvens TaxID=1443435 RepID=UPI000B03FFD2|nr:iron-containing alcohol dehydrogenase [Aneurinibacillus tyrosinisolvens]
MAPVPYTFLIPTQVECGVGVSQKIGEMVKEMNAKRVAIVTDKGMSIRNLPRLRI